MVAINKSVNLMRVYVTPDQFEAVHAAKLRIGNRTPETGNALQLLLSHCAQVNGGQYDPARHREGVSVELIVIV